MSRQEPGKARLLLILIAGTLSGILSNILATWADTTWGLSRAESIGITAAGFIAVVVFLALLEIGVTLPGGFVVHRYWYLFGLVKFEDLNQWATKFVTLHVKQGRKYVATIETLDRAGERQDLVRLMYQTLAARRRPSKHLLILGEPGCGKSTAVERLTLQLASHSLWRLGLRGPIPVLVRAGDYRPGDDLKAMLTDALDRWAVSAATRNVLTRSKSVQRLIDSGRLVILLDALDELTDERRVQMINMIGRMARSAGLARVAVVVTCRTRQDPEHLLPEYRPFSILDLSDEAIVKLIKVSAGEFDTDSEEIYNTLRDGGFLEVGGIGRNPFWLRELIRVGAVARTRAQILLAASHQRLMAELAKQPTAERSWRIPEELSAEQYAEECQRALAILAMGMDLGRSVPRDEALALLGPRLTERAQMLKIPMLVPNHVLELARDAALLDRRRDPVGFSHRIVQEFFAAYGLWSDEASVHAHLPVYVADPGRWQTLMMYVGLLSDARRSTLIEEVLATDQSPVGLACAIAMYVGDARSESREVEQKLYHALRDTLLASVQLDSQLEESLRRLVIVGHDRAAYFLGVLLADSEPVVRVHVCRILRLSVASEAVRLLAHVGLDDSNEMVVGAAVDSLVAIGAASVWVLIRQLFADRVSVRARASRALDLIGAPEATNFLLRADIDDAAAGEALASCGRQRVGRLLVALASREVSLRRRAAIALAGIHSPMAFGPMLRAVEDADERVRMVVLRALATWPVEAIEVGQIPKGWGSTPLAVLLQMVRDKERAAANAVLLIGEIEGEDATAALLSLVAEMDPEIRAAAVRGLGGRPGEEIRKTLLKCLRDPNGAIRGEAAEALRAHQDAEVTKALVRLLWDLDTDVCLSAVRALANRPAIDISSVFEPLLRDSDAEVQAEAARVLAERVGAARALALAVQASRNWPNHIVPDGGAEASWTGESRFSVALELLRTGTPMMRRLAAAALQDDSSSGGTDKFVPLLADEEREVRRVAVSLLMSASEPAAAEALVAALRDSDVEVRHTAVRGLVEAGRSENAARLSDVIEELVRSPLAAQRFLAVDLIGCAIDVGGPSMTAGPRLLALLLQMFYDADTDVSQSAAEALAQAPTSWTAVQLPGFLALHDAPPTAALLRLVARVGEPRTTDLVAAALGNTARETRVAAVRAAAALGNVKLLPMLLRVVRDETVDQRLQVLAVEALSLMGPVVWPQLRELLADRSLPEPLTATVVEALGMSGDFDGTTAYQLLTLIGHPSPRVSAAAVNALSNLSDLLQEMLFVPRLLRTTDARIQIHILRSLLSGQPLPDKTALADLTIGMTADKPVVDSEEAAPYEQYTAIETPDELLSGLRPHMRELMLRMGYFALIMAVLGVLGAVFSQEVVGFMGRVIFNGSPEMIESYIPPSPYQEQIISLLIVAWIGFPLLVYQIWQYAMPGMLPRELRLARPIVFRLIVLIVMTPLLNMVIFRLISFLNIKSFQEVDPMWLSMRLVIVAWCAIFWLVCFRPMWRWLAVRAKSSYFLSLELNDPILRPTFLSDGIRRRIFLTAFFSFIVLLFVPVYLTVSVLLGVPIVLLILAVFLYQLARSISVNSRRTLRRLAMYLSVFSPLLNVGLYFIALFPLVLIIVLYFRDKIIENSCRLSYGVSDLVYQAYCAAMHPGLVDWLVYTCSIWILTVILFAVQLVSNAKHIFRNSFAKRLALANFLLFVLLVASPSIASQAWRAIEQTRLTESVPVAFAFWLSVQVPVAVILLIWFGGWIAVVGWHSDVILLFSLVFLLMLTPVTVLLGILSLPGVAILLALPAIIDVLISYGPRTVIFRTREWLMTGGHDYQVLIAFRNQFRELLTGDDS